MRLRSWTFAGLAFLSAGIVVAFAAGIFPTRTPIGEQEGSFALPFAPGGPRQRGQTEPPPPTPGPERNIDPSELKPDMTGKPGVDEHGNFFEVNKVDPKTGAPYKKGQKIYGPINGTTNPYPKGANQ